MAFLKKKAEDMCKGNSCARRPRTTLATPTRVATAHLTLPSRALADATTIHAINSCVLKVSKLMKARPQLDHQHHHHHLPSPAYPCPPDLPFPSQACRVYRGSTRGALPASFFEKDAFGLSGGVELGFSSTTVERAQAEHYAQGRCSNLFEMEQGMVDRGADISWLSQYPHEKEVLFPPLLGQEMLRSRVDGTTLVMQTRLSLNMLSLTLEQVVGKRRKLVGDMAQGMALELRGALGDGRGEVSLDGALKVLRETPALAEEAPWSPARFELRLAIS